MTDSTPLQTSEILTVRPRDGLVTVIERFALDDEAAVESGLSRISDHIASQWRSRPDHRGSLLLRHLALPGNIFTGPSDVRGMAVYSRWQSGDGDARAGVPAEWSVAELLPDARILGSRTYSVDFSESLSDGDAGSPISRTATPFAHMGIFSNFTADQESVLVAARRHSAESLSPGGVVGVNFHASHDGEELINLGQWESLEILKTLSQQTRFAKDDHYWDGMSDFEGMFFDVIAVHPAASD